MQTPLGPLISVGWPGGGKAGRAGGVVRRSAAYGGRNPSCQPGQHDVPHLGPSQVQALQEQTAAWPCLLKLHFWCMPLGACAPGAVVSACRARWMSLVHVHSSWPAAAARAAHAPLPLPRVVIHHTLTGSICPTARCHHWIGSQQKCGQKCTGCTRIHGHFFTFSWACESSHPGASWNIPEARG